MVRVQEHGKQQQHHGTVLCFSGQKVGPTYIGTSIVVVCPGCVCFAAGGG